MVRRAVRRLFPTGAELRAHRTSLLLCLVSGLFGALLFHHNALGWLGWIALVPYFYALHNLQGKMLAWGTMLFGMTWYYLGLWWLHTLIVFHWMIPLGVAVGVIYVALYFLLFAFPASWAARYLPPGRRPIAIAVCWTGVEFLRGFTDMAFPWNLLGHSQVPINPFSTMIISTGGVALMSFVMALFNAAIAETLHLRRLRSPMLAMPVVSNVILLAVLCGALSFFFFARPLRKQVEPLKVAVIQPGISQLTKWDAYAPLPGETQEQHQQRYRDLDATMQMTAGALVEQAARTDEPELIVLPESLFLTNRFPYETALHESLEELSARIGADLVFGADNRIERNMYADLMRGGQRFLREADQPTTVPIMALPIHTLDDGTTVPDFLNEAPAVMTVSAWHVSKDTGLQQHVYNKMQLVPFGETVPFISGVEWLRNALEAQGIAGAFHPGFENTIFETDGIRHGVVICFESTFPHLTRELALGGASFVSVITNDAWYDPTYAIERGGFWGTLFKIPGLRQLAAAGPRQHFIHSQLRAMETGLPVVRSANNGISAIIDHNGTVQEELPYGESGYLAGRLNAHRSAPTPYVKWGDWLGLLCTGFWLALMVVSLRRPRPRRR